MSYLGKVAKDKNEQLEALRRSLFHACAKVAFERYKKGDKSANAKDIMREFMIMGGR